MLIRENVPLKDKCYYKTGGAAAFYAEPLNRDELRSVLLWAAEKDIPHEVIGCGANILISDEGYSGLIINMSSYERCIIKTGIASIYCGAGIKLFELIDFTVHRGLSGLENLSGIPGSVGGAIMMNAGAYGAEIKDTVISVSVLDKNGNERELAASCIGFCYRDAPGLKGYIVSGASFAFQKSSYEVLRAIRKEIFAKRRRTQPLEKPSCGSVFKRPPAGYAGELIEKCGLKGLRKGGAVISEKHANFVLNDNGATSADIKWLIHEAARRVREEFSVELQTEVRLIGFEAG